MIEQVGRLGDERVGVVSERRDDRLDRLLAQLLGDAGRAGGDQAGGVGSGIVGGGARPHDGREIVEREFGHGTPPQPSSRTGMPAAIICSFTSRIVKSPK